MLDIPADPIGLPSKVFNQHLDGMLIHGQLNPEIIEHMNDFQQGVINELKKALARLKNKNGDIQEVENGERVGTNNKA